MDWLFERTIEIAAWVAFILCVIFLCDSVWMLYLFVRDYGGEANSSQLANSLQAAIKFVGAAIAMGVLACIDHYVFDLPDES